MIEVRTYIYSDKEGGCVHINACGGVMGNEYKHVDPNWQPPNDWPYEIIDNRKD